jgi:hypothetical protein
VREGQLVDAASPDAPAAYGGMSDELIMVHAALELSKQVWVLGWLVGWLVAWLVGGSVYVGGALSALAALPDTHARAQLCCLPSLHCTAPQTLWSLPPEFHLRLMHALCNDVINCYNMKAEISARCVCVCGGGVWSVGAGMSYPHWQCRQQ